MKNSQVNEELFSPNYGQVPGALPSPAAIKPLPFSNASPTFSSFTGSPSPLQLGVDCNSADWQSLQKQQTNKELPGSQHSRMPVQYPGFNEQTDRDPPGSQHSHMPVQYPGFDGQTNRDPPGSQHSHMPVQYPGFIAQTNRDPPGSQHSHMPVPYPGFAGQTNRDTPGSQHSHMPVQYPGFTEPQIKQLLNLRSNMGPPRSHHAQLPQQHLGLAKDQLSLQLQQYMETPWSSDTQLHLQLPIFTEHPLKWQRGSQFDQEPKAITASSTESQPQQPIRYAPLTFNQNKSAAQHVRDVSKKPEPMYGGKGKEKVTSSSANMQSVMNEPLVHGFPGNWGQLNTSYPSVPSKESYHPRLPSDFMQALEGCKPPQATITDPYDGTDEVMFDIPFFRNAGSTNPSGTVSNSNSLSLSTNMKDPPSRKGKEVVNIKKRRHGE